RIGPNMPVFKAHAIGTFGDKVLVRAADRLLSMDVPLADIAGVIAGVAECLSQWLPRAWIEYVHIAQDTGLLGIKAAHENGAVRRAERIVRYAPLHGTIPCPERRDIRGEGLIERLAR